MATPESPTAPPLLLPPLYAVADAETLSRHGLGLKPFLEQLHAAGVSLVQLRHKTGNPRQVLESAALLRHVFAPGAGTLILNDRADLAALAGFDGVHVGQDDLAVADARLVLERSLALPAAPAQPTRTLVGVSTHTLEQVRRADLTSADYLAIGPVFATATKLDAAPAVGLEGVRRARALTSKPLVAIGGITRASAPRVLAAGADSLAVISALLVPGQSVEQVARDFLAFFR